ncbi:hypothetical protein ScPMuIL_009503 [Solemya velum]
MSRTFKNTGTKYIVTNQNMLHKLEAAVEDLQMKGNIMLVDGDTAASLDKLVAMGEEIKEDLPKIRIISKTTIAALLSTSGTTGFPKAAQLSHYAIIAMLYQLQHAVQPCYAAGSVSVVFLPMYHMFGLCVVLSLGLVQGLQHVIMSRFYPQEYLKNIANKKANLLHVVPPVMALLANHPMVCQYDLSSVEHIVCGAAPLCPELARKLQNRIGVQCILEGYGMTELGVPFVNTEAHHKLGSVGRKVKLVQSKIVSVETGKELGPNIKGEIWIRGPQIFNGYLNNREATDEMMKEDGWARSGDVGYMDGDGYLFIVDRIKELIKYKGHQIAPAQLDHILLDHPDIADAAVIGIKDEEAGEIPKAFIVRKQGTCITESDAQEFLSLRVAPHMKLRGGVEFIDEIPKSPTGKILRRELQTKDAFVFPTNP